MHRLIAIVMISLGLLDADICDAVKPQPPGALPAGVALWSDDKVGLDGWWWIVVSAWSLTYTPEAMAEVDLKVGPEVELLEGDTHRRVHPHVNWGGPSDSRWMLKVRKKQDGTVSILGSLSMNGAGPGNSYSYECQMKLRVQGSSVETVENRTVIAVKTQNGRKFRYGSHFPVALEGDDLEATPVAIDSKPELLSDPVVKGEGDSFSSGVEVKVVASIGKSGKVLWIYPQTLGGVPMEEGAWKEITDAVGKFRFRPATSNGRPVTDNLIFAVRLAPR